MIVDTSVRSWAIGVGETSNRVRKLLPLFPHRVEVVSHHLLSLHLSFVALALSAVEYDKNERGTKDNAEKNRDPHSLGFTRRHYVVGVVNASAHHSVSASSSTNVHPASRNGAATSSRSYLRIPETRMIPPGSTASMNAWA